MNLTTRHRFQSFTVVLLMTFSGPTFAKSNKA